MARIPVVAHRHLTLIWCDSSASLAEVMATVDFSEIPHQRFGERAVAVPSTLAGQVRDALRATGAFPRVIGEPRRVDEEGDE